MDARQKKLHPCPKQPLFGHDSIENRTLVPENHPFRARPFMKLLPMPKTVPFRAQHNKKRLFACTFGMKSHCCTHQNHANPSTHTVILSAAKNPHGTTFTFVIKLQQVPVTLKETACSFVTKSLQITRLWRGPGALWARNCIRSSVVGNSQVRGRLLRRAARSA